MFSPRKTSQCRSVQVKGLNAEENQDKSIHSFSGAMLEKDFN